MRLMFEDRLHMKTSVSPAGVAQMLAGRFSMPLMGWLLIFLALLVSSKSDKQAWKTQMADYRPVLLPDPRHRSRITVRCSFRQLILGLLLQMHMLLKLHHSPTLSACRSSETLSQLYKVGLACCPRRKSSMLTFTSLAGSSVSTSNCPYVAMRVKGRQIPTPQPDKRAMCKPSVFGETLRSATLWW